MAIIYSSSFTGSDQNPLSESGAWAIPTGRDALKRISNRVEADVSGGMAYATNGSITGDHISSWVIAATGDPGIACRMQSGNGDSYVLFSNGGNIELYKYVSASYNGPIKTYGADTFDVNDRWALGARTVGADCELTCYKDGVQFGTTFTDTSSPLTGGKPGAHIFSGAIDDFEAHDFAGGGADILMGQILT